MHSYGQFCPVALAAEIFCERWNAVILRELASGSTRFSDIQRGAPLMSPSLLTKRLKELEEAGVVERRKSKSGRAWEYRLTDAGWEFEPIVRALGVWGCRWVSQSLGNDKLDVSLLMWDMRRAVRPEVLDRDPAVIHFAFTDQPKARSNYWLVCEGGQVALCLTEPTRDVDLYVTTDAGTLVAVWRADIPLQDAIDRERIELHGPPSLCASFGDFLGESPWVGIPRLAA
jgi:DNA-binding HxlR family transcriptional regulator